MVQFKLFVIAVMVLLCTDMVWLGYVAKNMYIDTYASWLRLDNGQLQPVWWATAIVYVLLPAAIIVFVVPLAQGSIAYALLYGAVMGAMIYGVYDFTCLALFKDWPVSMAFIDWAWGTFLLGFSSAITVYCSRFF